MVFCSFKTQDMMKTAQILIIYFLFMALMPVEAQTNNTDEPSPNGDVIMNYKVSDHHLLPSLLQQKTIDDAINLDPGIAPDGDEQGRSVFTLDGTKVITSNGLTNNITIFDWDTQMAIANVDVGMYPVDVSVTDDYAIVSCLNDSSLVVVSLSDYSIASILEMPGQTFSSTVNDDGSLVYGHCYEGDFSTMVVYSLTDFTEQYRIDSLPALPFLQSWVTGSGRISLKFFTFDISFTHDILITPDADDAILFYDLNTGDLLGQTTGMDCYEGDLSLDEGTYVTITINNPATVYQIDLMTQSVIDNFDLSIGYWASSLVCNADGTRAFFGGNNKGHIIDFTDDTHEIFSINTAFNAGTTADKQYIYSCNFKAAVLDFETKSVIGIHQGNTQSICCVSPIGYKAFAYNNLFWEGGFFYDFSTLNSLNYLGSQFFGSPPEGDVPTRVAITPDGTKAVVTNPLSWTVSIVDLTTNTVSSVLDVEESSKFVVITHDGNWAIVSGYDMNAIKIIDLNNEEIVAFVTTNQRPGNMVVSPDDQYVYVTNIKANTISKVLLDGANSNTVMDIPCGVIGGSYSAYGIYSNLAITPDGAYLIAPIPFDNLVKIIETSTMTIVAELNTGDFPLQVAINTDGTYATVTNQSADTYSVIHVDGANSSIVGTYSNGLGNPIRVKYNPIMDEMAIVDYQNINLQWQVLHTDPETGNLLYKEIHDGYGATLDAGNDSEGTSVILTGAQPLPNGNFGDSYVLMEDLAFPIAPGPIAFDVCTATNVAVCACGGGGPDFISIVYLQATGVNHENSMESPYLIYPNPVQDILHIKGKGEINAIKIYNANGKLMMEQDAPSLPTDLFVGSFPTGYYFISFTNHQGVQTVMPILKL
jgi:DNA-binding beta-propeller fold protein YncE